MLTRSTTGAVTPSLVALPILFLLGACAVPEPPPKPVVWSVSEASRASISDVVLAPSGFRVRPAVRLPAKGAGEGAGRGAAIGAAAPVAAGAQSGDAYILLVGILLAPFTTVIGTGIGAASALSTEEVEKAEQAVMTAFSEVNFQERLASELRKRLETKTGRSVVEPVPGPKTGEDLPNFAATSRADAVIKVRVTKVALQGPWSINPTITFVLDARARLIQLPSGRLLWDRPLSYTGPGLPLTEWSQDKASPLRRQIALAIAASAERIVEELFLLHVPSSMDNGPT